MTDDTEFLWPDEPITGSRMEATMQLVERLPERFQRYPVLPMSWSQVCTYCGVGTVKREGYSNWYWAVYRCDHPLCGKAMSYTIGMDRYEWRFQIDPYHDEPVDFEHEVNYPFL